MKDQTPPTWAPPFEPDLDRALLWFRKRASDSLLREIASAELGYLPSVRTSLARFLESGEAHGEELPLLWNCELRSNHWYQDGPSPRLTLIISGAVALALVFVDEQSQSLASDSRIAFVMRAAIEHGDGAIEAVLHVLAWCAERQRATGQSESPCTFLAFASLCGVAVILSGRRAGGSPCEWASVGVAESIAAEIPDLVEADALFQGDSQAAGDQWLVGLDSNEPGPWWALARSTLKHLGDDMPRVRAVMERVMTSCPTWKG